MYTPEELTTDDDTIDALLANSQSIAKDGNATQHKPPIRNVMTPMWTKDTCSLKHELDEFSHVEYMSHDRMADVHWKCEVLEHRINHGKDKEHIHPAMVVEILNRIGVKDVTSHESKRRGRYDTQVYRESLPDFWPPRPWDTTFKKMNHQDSINLLEDIKQSHKYRNHRARGARWMSSEDDYSDGEFDPDAENQTDRPRPQMITRSRRRQLGMPDDDVDITADSDQQSEAKLVNLSTKMFETDNESELTDDEIMDYYY